MDKYEKLQELFYQELDESVKKNLLDPKSEKVVRTLFQDAARRINRIEAINFIEFAKKEGLLK